MAGKLWAALSPLLLGPDRYADGANRPDVYGDTRSYWAYIYDKADAEYGSDAAADLVSRSVAVLTGEQLDALYDFYVPLSHPRSPLRKRDTGRAYFHELAARLRGNPEGKSDFTLFTVSAKEHYREIADRLEALLGPERVAALADRLGQIRSPRDPGYGKPREIGSCDAYIQAMRDRLAGADEKRRQVLGGLLDRAAALTREATDEVAGYYDSIFKEADDFVQHNPRPASYRAIERKIGKEAFASLPMLGSGEGAQIETTSDVSTPAFRPLLEKETEYLGEEPELTGAYRDAVLEMLRGMDAMTEDYRRYDGGVSGGGARLPGAVTLGERKNMIFSSEQGAKYYALYPAASALMRLKDTLRRGDWEGLKAAVENAEEKKRAVGALIGAAHAHFSPRGIFSANVNSTRKDVRKNVPPEFLSDYTGHSQVNSIYHLYAFCKNMGVSFEDALDRPLQTMRQVTERYLRDNGVNSRENPGAALFRFSNKSPAFRWFATYDDMIDRMLGRGIDGVAGGEPDAEKAYLRVLRETPAKDWITPAFRRFRRSVVQMSSLVRSPDVRREMDRAAAKERTAESLVHRDDDLTEMLRAFQLPTGEALASVDVKTYPISGSAEYQKMARALMTAMQERE